MRTVLMLQPADITLRDAERYYQMRWERRNLRMRITLFILLFVGIALSLLALA